MQILNRNNLFNFARPDAGERLRDFVGGVKHAGQTH